MPVPGSCWSLAAATCTADTCVTVQLPLAPTSSTTSPSANPEVVLILSSDEEFGMLPVNVVGMAPRKSEPRLTMTVSGPAPPSMIWTGAIPMEPAYAGTGEIWVAPDW